MINILKYAFLAITASVALSGCTGVEDDPNVIISPDFLKVNTEITIDSQTNSGQLIIESNCEWRIEGVADIQWLEVDGSVTTGTGNANITLKCTDNDGTGQRLCNLRVVTTNNISSNVKIYQNKVDKLGFKPLPNDYKISALGGTYDVEIVGNIDCVCTITDGTEYLDLGNSNNNYSYSFGASDQKVITLPFMLNNKTTERSVTLKLYKDGNPDVIETLTITQKAGSLASIDYTGLNLDDYSFTVTGSITSDSKITEYGIRYHVNDNTDDVIIVLGTPNNNKDIEINHTISGLSGATTYHVAIYAINEVGENISKYNKVSTEGKVPGEEDNKPLTP